MGNTALWVRIALANLVIIALLGTIMRYKIGFEFPFFDQKYLQEAHSHFAFTGWISHSLYFLLVILLRNNLDRILEKLYSLLILGNLVCAYGMLISFSVQGYGPVSILFSSLSLLTGYVFAFFAFRDAGRLPSAHPSKNWIKAAILFSVMSTLGTIQLSYMMASRQYDQTTYLGSVFFFLHFQYNGWFLFACMGLFLDRIKETISAREPFNLIFWLFFLAGIPAYFLSTLWANLPVWLYAVVVVAAFLQIFGWFFVARFIRSRAKDLKLLFSKTAILLFSLVGLALTLKLFLQLGSTIPAVSKLAFGFRPIVIAYLHLVLLLIVTVFLLTYMFSVDMLHSQRRARLPLVIFACAAILNETVLAVQGIGAFSYTVIPYANEALFLIALTLLLSAALLFRIHFTTSKS